MVKRTGGVRTARAATRSQTVRNRTPPTETTPIWNIETIEDHAVDENACAEARLPANLLTLSQGVLKFLIKWEGFDAECDKTWEPEQNLQ
ncbi:hypothetical protein Purlil1_13045 [Purpureocillium lilacinum]|uniref:Chromo domain-containing protein n=1 Tax=Purpureocillium lilacinum TaxID=33203 RepID=A0ABR0BF45_PURLI|nr:hypothetical protein Purlil1_13045 [Purpureocillium lilacinum]